MVKGSIMEIIMDTIYNYRDNYTNQSLVNIKESGEVQNEQISLVNSSQIISIIVWEGKVIEKVYLSNNNEKFSIKGDDL